MCIGVFSACTIRVFSGSWPSNYKGPVKCVSLNNRCQTIDVKPCQTKPTLVETNSNETLFYPFAVSVTKCGGRFDIIDHPYAPVWIPNKVKIWMEDYLI